MDVNVVNRRRVEHGLSAAFRQPQNRRDRLQEEEYLLFSMDSSDFTKYKPKRMQGVHYTRDSQGGYKAHTFAEARQKTDRCFMGGVNEHLTNMFHPNELETQVKNALRETNGKKLILASGCSLPTDMPVEQIDIIYRAIRKFRL